jgi:hypothetical protein
MRWTAEFSSVKKYWDYINHNFYRVNSIIPFRMYSFSYHFKTDNIEDWKIKLKLYDYFPLIFCFRVEGSDFWGLNFHHLPLQARLNWLDRLREISKNANEIVPYIDFSIGDNYKLQTIPYPLVYKMSNRKDKIAIRRYRMKGVLNLRLINLALVDDSLKFISSTYLDGNIQKINMRYRNYQP